HGILYNMSILFSTPGTELCGFFTKTPRLCDGEFRLTRFVPLRQRTQPEPVLFAAERDGRIFLGRDARRYEACQYAQRDTDEEHDHTLPPRHLHEPADAEHGGEYDAAYRRNGDRD